MSQIKLPQDMIKYFSLFLIQTKDDSELAGVCIYVAVTASELYHISGVRTHIQKVKPKME